MRSMIFCLLILVLHNAVFSQLLSNCTEDDEFEFIYENIVANFTEAELGCQQLEPSASLASIQDNVTQNFVINFISTIEEADLNRMWLGLRREPSAANDPNLFFFIDGTVREEGFGNTIGVFPWAQGRPNNAGMFSQECVM